MRTSTVLTAFVAAVAAFTISVIEPPALAHCQIPCGIYDDPMRITMLREDATTIRKAVASMHELLESTDSVLALNQEVRWVTVKDETATNIQRIIADYFLTQRVKSVPAGDPGHAAYLDQLAKMHAILVAAMKCKQTADPTSVDALDAAIDAIAGQYTHDHGG
jgi:nickel superoxide dismutase